MKFFKNCIAKSTGVKGRRDSVMIIVQGPVHKKKTIAKGKLWWHPKKKKDKLGERAAVEKCDLYISQWFLHNHAPRLIKNQDFRVDL